MAKYILILSTSPRKGGNSETLADEFLRGAKEAGNEVEKVCLYDKTIGFCKDASPAARPTDVLYMTTRNSLRRR